MGACWHKERWLPGELDTVTGQPLPGAMPPGIYCEDEATFEALAKAPGIERVANGWTQREGPDPTWRPMLTAAGMMVRVATPAEAEILRALAPAAAAPDEAGRDPFEGLPRGKLFRGPPPDGAGTVRDPEALDTIDRLPARTGASQTLTSGTVTLRWTRRSKVWLGPRNLHPVTGPNRRARRAAAKARRA